MPGSKVALYGIPNCDTVKKARDWLTAHGIDYRFHDFKKEGLDAVLLDGWLTQVGWEILLNRKGMMWRKLDEAIRSSIDASSARAVMLETPTIIKRPVLMKDDKVSVGFKPADYETLFG